MSSAVPSSSSNAKVIVKIIRHGETEHNHQKIIQGHIDTPLNELGEGQARITARFLRSTIFDYAFSSDLVRAAKTGQTILDAQESNLRLVQDDRIRERHLGELQGKRWGDMGADISTAEPTTIFEGRLLSFWSSLFSSTSSLPLLLPLSEMNDTRYVLITSHGGSIRQLIAGLFKNGVNRQEGDYEIDLPEERKEEGMSRRVTNCSITTIEMEQFLLNDGSNGRKWKGRLLSYAEDAHFIDSSRAVSPSINVDIID